MIFENFISRVMDLPKIFSHRKAISIVDGLMTNFFKKINNVTVAKPLQFERICDGFL
jgi:hypothetical protein